MAKNASRKMKAVNSSSSSLLQITIPQFQQLLPLEANLSGSWVNSVESLSTANKLLSPPISITPSSICTDFSDGEFQPVDLSSSRKYSLSTPPLSNIKAEPIDSVDCPSPHSKGESMMILSNDDKFLLDRSISGQKCSNFTIERLLSSTFRSPPTYHYLTTPSKAVQSIFTKKQTKHFSDDFLHRIVQHRKRSKHDAKRSSLLQWPKSPRGRFLPYVFDFVKDLITQHHQIKSGENFFSIDALEQLAEIACKLDPRHARSILHDEKLTSKTYQFLLKQCHLLIKQIYQKYQQKKHPKRLYYRSTSSFKRHMVHLPISLRNLLLMKRDLVVEQQSDGFIVNTSDNEKKKSTKIIRSRCFHLTPDQIAPNLEILLPNKGLVYEGTVQSLADYHDLLLIRLNHERQTYLIPIHDLCRLSCPKMIPTDFEMFSKGSRVCAYWSTSLRGLHPAKVSKLPKDVGQSSMVTLRFDDGDMGLIKLNEIRLLPESYQIQGIDLEEWRVSSSQITSSLSTGRRSSRRSTSSCSPMIPSETSIKKSKNEKKTSKPIPPVIPQWVLSTRNSTISRPDSNEVLRVGDCVVLHGADKSLSYIGRVMKFSRNRSTQQDLVRLKWYYSPQETPIGLQSDDLPGALYESTHIDDNPISTIRQKGTIYQSYDDYVQKTESGKRREDTDFYLVGRYDPISGELQRFADNK